MKVQEVRTCPKCNVGLIRPPKDRSKPAHCDTCRRGTFWDNVPAHVLPQPRPMEDRLEARSAARIVRGR